MKPIASHTWHVIYDFPCPSFLMIMKNNALEEALALARNL
jgi:hypothetical protein